jgi:UDP-glucose 4-epimerase
VTRLAVVTGAYGFIGRHAARRLAAEGCRVIGIGHGGWTQSEAARWGLAEWHAADVNLDALFTYAGEPDLIVHGAGSGSVGFSVSHPFQDFQRNVTTTAAVLEFSRLHAPAARTVLLSSAAVYGEVERTPIAEDDGLRPVSPYGVHKKFAEDLCASFGRHCGVKSAVVRLFSVYGPELRKQLLWDASWRIRRNENGFFGTGRELRDWVYVEDVVDLLLKAGEHATAESPVVNGGTGEGVSVEDVLKELFRAFDRADEPRFSGQSRSGDPANYVADGRRARQWGWTPEVEWREGLCRYVRWFHDNHR